MKKLGLGLLVVSLGWSACGGEDGACPTSCEADALSLDALTTPDTRPLLDTLLPVDTAGPADVAVTDAGDDVAAVEGGFGWPCTSNVDCDSGWCVQGPMGYICTKLCEETCPSGFDCKSISAGGADIAFVCVPDLTCQPQPGPDLAGDDLDTNCDGIDGEVDNGVFVARNGLASNSGSRLAPLPTISLAIERAVAEGKRDVYVASGVYSENIVLAEGKGLFGGYSDNYAVRAPEILETAILGDPPTDGRPAAVTARGLGVAGAEAPTIIRGFTVFGPNAANVPGANSYALFIEDCGPRLEVRDNLVIGGAGGNGRPGAAGAGGADGRDGSPGQAAYDVGAFDGQHNRVCSNATHARAGGAGAAHSCGADDVSGGLGGRSACPVATTAPEAGAEGAKGAGAAGGAGGSAGWDMRIDSESRCASCLVPPDNHPYTAGLGQPGADGEDGEGGDGCRAAAGAVVAGRWVGGAGADGAAGAHGSGGGGGGSGAGVQVTGNECYGADETWGSDVGGSGGGGGSGGCRGTGGAGASAGTSWASSSRRRPAQAPGAPTSR